MIDVKLELPKFKVFEYDSRRGHIPLNMSVLNENFNEIIELNLIRDLALQGMNTIVMHSGKYATTVYYTPDYIILHTVQKYNKKRIDSGKKRTGDFGQPVTNFLVAYPSHVIVRCYLIPKSVVATYEQFDKYFRLTLLSYNDIVSDLYEI